MKIIDAFKALWDFIASGGSTDILGTMGEIAGRSYLEGFESSLTALPEIAGRQLSQKEKDLQAKVDGIAANLGDQFAAKFSERMVKLDGELGADFNKEIDLKLNEKVGEQLGKKLGMGGQQPLSASESRLLTRGPADKRGDLMEKILNKLNEIAPSLKNSEEANLIAASELARIQENTANTTQLVPTI
jgi:hypothetical protein